MFLSFVSYNLDYNIHIPVKSACLAEKSISHTTLYVTPWVDQQCGERIRWRCRPATHSANCHNIEQTVSLSHILPQQCTKINVDA